MLAGSCSNGKMGPCGRRAGQRDSGHCYQALPSLELLSVARSYPTPFPQALIRSIWRLWPSVGICILIPGAVVLLFIVEERTSASDCPQGQSHWVVGQPGSRNWRSLPFHQGYTGIMTIKHWELWKLNAGLVSTIWLQTVQINHPV